GALTDARGYRFAVGVGAVVMFLSASVRIYDASFGVLLWAQIGIAVAQPFVLNGISKLVADWFSEDQGAIATGLGTVGMFVGMALGLAVTPALYDAVGLRLTMVVFAALTGVAALVFALVVHPNAHRAAADAADAAGRGGFMPLLRNRPLQLLCVLSFLGLGIFNGLTSWIEPILAPQHINGEQAGLIG